MRLAYILLAGFWSVAGLPAAAQPMRAGPRQVPQNAQPGSDIAAHLEYQLYVRGLRVGRLESALELHAGKYRIEVAFRTFGLIGWLFHGHQLDLAEGRLGPSRPEPLLFSGEGVWRGNPRRVRIDYVGGQPVLRVLEPPNDEEREEVPPALRANTVDPLSAVVQLIRHVAASGRCEGGAVLFDGRRAVGLQVGTGRQEILEETRRSSFRGPALRCDFEGRVLAGFRSQDDDPDKGKPRHGTAWFAAAFPGAPLLPVRIEFETKWLGDATLYLIGAGPGAVRGPEQ